MTDPDRTTSEEARQPVRVRDPAAGGALLGAYLSQGTNLTTVMMSLSTASAAGMFALVDKASDGWQLLFWIVAVLGFGCMAWSSYHVLELDKQLVRIVSEKFGAQTDAQVAKAGEEEALLEPRIKSAAKWAKGAFFAAALAAMAFAITSRKVEIKDMSEQSTEQHGGGPQTTHQDGKDIYHREQTGLGKVVENTTPQPTQPSHQPSEGTPSATDAPKE